MRHVFRNALQQNTIHVIKIFEMTHPQNYMYLYLIVACSRYIFIFNL